MLFPTRRAALVCLVFFSEVVIAQITEKHKIEDRNLDLYSVINFISHKPTWNKASFHMVTGNCILLPSFVLALPVYPLPCFAQSQER